MSENRTQVLDVQSRPCFPSDSESCDQGIWSYDCLQFREPVPFFEDLFISMWLCWVFTAAHRLSLVAAVASPVAEHKLRTCRFQQLQLMGLVVSRHVGSSQTRD